jgi:hypothetical protein
MDKNDYYYISKTQLGIRSRARSKSQVELTINPGQRNDKNDYHHNFKTQLGNRQGARTESQVGLTIDLGQHNNKNHYYYILNIYI